jgi:hypothetical protein
MFDCPGCVGTPPLFGWVHGEARALVLVSDETSHGWMTLCARNWLRTATARATDRLGSMVRNATGRNKFFRLYASMVGEQTRGWMGM